jgi:hypothetical protein
MLIPHVLQEVHKDSSNIYLVDLGDGIEIPFRLPPIKKAQLYARLLSVSAGDPSLESHIYEYIFRSYVTSKTIADGGSDLPAGVACTIAQTILYMSGVLENTTEYTEKLFEENREIQQHTTPYMQRVICMAFPGYTFEALNELSYPDLVHVFIQAEKSLLELNIIEKEHKIAKEKTNTLKKAGAIDLDKLMKEQRTQLRSAEANPVGVTVHDDPARQAREARMRALQQRRDQNPFA